MAAAKKKTPVWVLVLVALPILAVVGLVALRLSVLIVRIPQAGMFPTYAAGSRVILSRAGEVGRGEVALFEWPERPDTDFIQRAMARDGDVLELGEDGRPVINGWAVPSCDVGPGSYDYDGAHVTGTIAVEFLEGHAYLVFHSKPQAPKRLVAKPGEWLFLGDNRNHSYDSRDFGGVRSIRGRPRSEEELHVPSLLQGPLKDCLDKQPPRDKTVPPPPAR